MTFRFLHVAEVHLDAPIRGVSATAPAVATVLRDASLGAFDELVRVAIARDVAFVVLAGGVHHGGAHGVRGQVELRRGLGELADRGIRTFVALSGDDPLDEGWTAVREWPDLVTFFPADEPLTVVVERDGEAIATVHGISQGHRGATDALAPRISRTDDPGVHIAVVHVGVGGHPLTDGRGPSPLDHLAVSGIDYWAIGGADTYAVLAERPWVVDPGTIQARASTPGNVGPKGGCLVEVNDQGIDTVELVPLDRVRVDRVEFGIEGVADVGVLRDRLVDLARGRLARAEGRSVVLQVELVGRGPVHGELHRPGAMAELVDALRVESLTEPPLVWWDRVDLATRPVQDLTELQGRNDFVADLVDEAAALLADVERRTLRTHGWDEELPADLAHLLEADFPDPVDPGRWREAQDLAIELVAGDDR